MKTFVIALTIATTLASVAEAGMRCTTIGNTTRCRGTGSDSGMGTIRCTTIGSTVRCR